MASVASSSSSSDTNCCIMTTESLAKAQTRVIILLRRALVSVLLVTAALVSTGVFLYTRKVERQDFTRHFENDALQVINSFHQLVERNIAAVASMSTAITSFAQHTNQSFPFVTLPDFELHGSHVRVLSGSHVVHWMPIVTDEKRAEWEDYAFKNRDQIDQAFQRDMMYRSEQDAEFGIPGVGERSLQEDAPLNTTILDDGTGFHPKIWRIGSVVQPGDEPEGGGPYLPLWQRSPVDEARQAPLNLNFANTKALRPDIIECISREKKAILNSAESPVPELKERLIANLRLSQYREHVDEYVDGLSTFLAYPVFDSFDENKQVTGILATNVYWKFLFSFNLAPRSGGIIVVVENSFNQTFSYRIDGEVATFLQMGDVHDKHYDHFVVSADVNEYLEKRAGPKTAAYGTVPLNDDSHYRIRVFPSKENEDKFITAWPIIYTAIVICGFAFSAILFLGFSYTVEKRQQVMVKKVIENARKAAEAERELNEFLSHEVRNPLAAAMSACSFVSSAVNESDALGDPETLGYIREDIEVVSSSLSFINDFLRSMLDIHRADGHIKVEMAPTDILRDILDPVSNILYKRVANFEVQVDCPESLAVMTDSIRLKQVVLNLVRNASKFVERGFLRMRANVIQKEVFIYVEDSGPGIPPEKRNEIFARYQASLDLLSQGTGIGLNLSKKLMKTMNGDIWLDDSYNSGVEGCRGACFVLQLNTSPLDIESTLPLDDSESDAHREALLADKTLDVELGAHTVRGASDEEINFQQSVDTGSPSELPVRLSVLFVDDDAVLRKLFVRAVRKVAPAWHILEACNGETALRLCESEKFDLIFLDQYMASVDKQLLGIETSQQMRSRGVTCKICGLSANNLRDIFIKAGADEFILKPMPCKPDELKVILLGILSKSAGHLHRDGSFSV